MVTNSRYDKLKVDEDSPFYPILQGKPELVFAADYDELMGETLAKVGISMIEEHRDDDGVLLVFANPTESQAIGKNLGYRSAFKQVSMINDSIVMVVDSETNVIRYMAKDINGELVPGDGSFNYTGLNVSALGIAADKLTDDFNGNMRVKGETCFASVKRSGNRFFLVMRPVEVTVTKTILPVITVVFAAFTYCMLLIFVSCRKHKIKDLDTEKEIKTVLSSVTDSDSRVNTTLEDIVRKKKPYFEERWPRDCKKWKDKTAGEKFPVLIRFVLIIAVFDVLLHSWRVGSDSIWYYCFNGEWGSGINLYSLSACMMWICILVIAKMVLHKLLFLIAKVATPRGETICNLLDNYMAYVLTIAGFFICLSNFGINTKALTLTGGAVGVIFGIGCQTVVADILSGFIMAIEGLVHNGDEVKLAADTKIVLGSGREEPVSIVLNVGIRTIMLKKVDGIMVVRNNEFRNYILLSKKAERTAIEEISAIIEEEVGSLEGKEGPFESAPQVPAEPKAQKAPAAPMAHGAPKAAPKASRKKVEK